MQVSKEEVPEFLARVIVFGVILTLSSSLYRSEFYFPPSVEPCVMQIFRVTLKQTSYGFPGFWLASVEGVYKYGCGPIVGQFLEHSIRWQGFLSDILLYAFCCSLIIYLRNRFKRADTNSRVNLSPVS